MPERNIEGNQKNGNDAVIQVKNNQKTSARKIREFIQDSEAISTYEEQEEKARNRIEFRKTEIFLTPMSMMEENTLFEYARCFVRVNRKTDFLDTKKKQWKTREQISDYIATVTYDAKTMAKIIQNHWGIENSNNYIRDVVLKEDESRIRVNPGIIACVRSFTLNILRFNKVKNIKRTIHMLTMDFNRILNLKGIF